MNRTFQLFYAELQKVSFAKEKPADRRRKLFEFQNNFWKQKRSDARISSERNEFSIENEFNEFISELPEEIRWSKL